MTIQWEGTPMALREKYKGWYITVGSYATVGGWAPSINVSTLPDRENDSRVKMPGRFETFETREIAEQKGLEAAKAWVDARAK